MYEILIEEKLQEILKKLFKKNKKVYEICIKKIEQIINNPEQYKPLKHDMKTIRRVHMAKSFVLTFRIEKNRIKFLDFDHHDNIYKN